VVLPPPKLSEASRPRFLHKYKGVILCTRNYPEWKLIRLHEVVFGHAHEF